MIAASPFGLILLQCIDEGHQLILLGVAEGTVVINHEVGFAVVTQYCVVPGERLSVVHQSVSRTDAPQRRRPHEIG